MLIRPLLIEDFPVVKEIYSLGIATGNATFETEAPDWEKWDQSHLKDCRFVAVDGTDQVIGWSALTAVSGRCAYAGVAEVSVYVHPSHSGRGVGKKLLEQLIHESEKNDLWTLQAGVFPENIASLKIHEKCGFRMLGRREKIGKMKGIWRDTLLLEKRSSAVGHE